MWKSYITSAIRSFIKKFQIALINLIGLSMAFTSYIEANKNSTDVLRYE